MVTARRSRYTTSCGQLPNRRNPLKARTSWFILGRFVVKGTYGHPATPGPSAASAMSRVRHEGHEAGMGRSAVFFWALGLFAIAFKGKDSSRTSRYRFPEVQESYFHSWVLLAPSIRTAAGCRSRSSISGKTKLRDEPEERSSESARAEETRMGIPRRVGMRAQGFRQLSVFGSSNSWPIATGSDRCGRSNSLPVQVVWLLGSLESGLQARSRYRVGRRTRATRSSANQRRGQKVRRHRNGPRL